MSSFQSSIDKNIYPIILSGGSGTRLWPLSRKSMPKQFLKLGGLNKSLLQLAVDRVANLAPPENCWIMTGASQEELCRKQVENPKIRILTEPLSRNTAPAIAYSAWNLIKENPDAIMVILPADHAIQNVRSFEQSVYDAVTLAKRNLYVTIGIQPTYPATGFGYIEQGLPLDEEGNIIPPLKLNERSALGYSVRSFREKPNLAAAEQFLRTGKYLWNAGIFVWRAASFWNAFSHIQPEIAALIEASTPANLEKQYAQMQNISIDVAFLERTSHLACVPANFDWNDVGCWSAVRECFDQDSQGNSISGQSLAIESKNIVVHTNGPFVSVLGMNDVVVVATPDAVLVTPLSRSQDIKKIIQDLENHRAELL